MRDWWDSLECVLSSLRTSLPLQVRRLTNREQERSSHMCSNMCMMRMNGQKISYDNYEIISIPFCNIRVLKSCVCVCICGGASHARGELNWDRQRWRGLELRANLTYSLSARKSNESVTKCEFWMDLLSKEFYDILWTRVFIHYFGMRALTW